MMWATSWPSTKRICSGEDSSFRELLSTMKGWSTPTAPALASGVCDTYSGGTFVSRMSHASMSSRWRSGYCVGPTLSAWAW